MHPVAAGSRPRVRFAALTGTLILVALLAGGLYPTPGSAARAVQPGGSGAPLAVHADIVGPAVLPHPAATSTAWSNRTAALTTAPPVRTGGMMAYDAFDGYLLLFGGLSARGGALRDTWSYQNGTWTNLTPSIGLSPPARYKATMAYDAADGYILLYAGLHGSAYLNDTWTYRHGVWTPLLETTSPGYLEDAGMAYDAFDGYVILFGGDNQLAVDKNTTWRFSGGAWTNITSLVRGAPPAEETAPLSYDASRHAVLMFGGVTPGGAINQTWSYQSYQWRDLTGTTKATPSVRESASLAYDAVDGYTLMYGGLRFPGTLSDTWAFQNGSWVLQSTPNFPPKRFDAAMAYTPGPAPGLASVVLFGGQQSSAANGTRLGDTWTYKLPLTATVTVTPSVIDVGQAALVQLDAVGGFPPYNVTWANLPANCAGLGVPGTFSCAPLLPGVALLAPTITDGVNNTAQPTANLTVNRDPMANVVGDPTIGVAPLLVQFGITLSGGTAPFTYAWKFGDNGTSTVGNVSHSYRLAGVYHALLTATDALGVPTPTSSVTIQVVNALAANASASVYWGIAPLTVNFSGTSAGGLGPYEYNWSFGVGGSGNNQLAPAFTYSSAGTYAAQFLVQDALGQTATSRVNIEVVDPLTASIASAFPQGAACTANGATAVLALSTVPSGGTLPYNVSWKVGSGTYYGSNVSVTVAGGSSVLAGLVVSDARGQIVSTTSSPIVAPTLSCGGTTGGTGSTPTSTFTIFWAMAGLLGIVIIAESLVLLSGRRKGGT